MVSRISPIPNSPMTATMKSKPFMSSVTPNVRRSAPVTRSRPTEARMKPRRMETRDLMGLPPPRPMNAEKVRSWMAKNSGGPNLRATSARRGAKRVISTTEKSAPTKDDVKAAVSACPPSPRRAMGEPSKVGATDQGSPGGLERGGGGGHGEGQRQEDRPPVGPAEAREHADDGAERDADHRHHQVVRLQRHLEA